jgi:hypothetical protein
LRCPQFFFGLGPFQLKLGFGDAHSGSLPSARCLRPRPGIGNSDHKPLIRFMVVLE